MPNRTLTCSSLQPSGSGPGSRPQVVIGNSIWVDSLLEGGEFELPVPRATKLRFRDFALAPFADVHLRQLQIMERRRHTAKPAIMSLGRPCMARGSGNSNSIS